MWSNSLPHNSETAILYRCVHRVCVLIAITVSPIMSASTPHTMSPIPKELLEDLQALVQEQHPNIQNASVDELLDLLLPQLPEELSANKTVLNAISQALSSIPKE